MKIIQKEFLPSNTKSCHASTVEMWNGHPVFAWFGGSREGAQDVCIYLYNLEGNGKTIKVGNKDAIPRWNPILVNTGGSLLMFEKAGIFCDRWQTFVNDITKWDANITEKEMTSKRVCLPAGLNGPVKTRPIVDCEGSMFCGSSVETIYDWTSYIEEYENDLTFMGRSMPITVEDKVKYSNSYNGRTEVTKGIIQPALWMEDDIMCAFFRSSGGMGSIYYSESEYNDGWSNWSKPVPTNLLNPNSGIDVVTYQERLFLVWNPSNTSRYPLVVSEIKRTDSGNIAEFECISNINIGHDIDSYNFIEKGCNSPELSYPYMIEDDGKLHVTYTCGRRKIEYVVIDIDGE